MEKVWLFTENVSLVKISGRILEAEVEIVAAAGVVAEAGAETAGLIHRVPEVGLILVVAETLEV